MPSIGVKLYSVFFKLMLKHRLQSRLQTPENDASGGSFGVTSRPDEETAAAANPSFTDGVATKDIHIDPITSLSVRVFLPDTCLQFPETRGRCRTEPSNPRSDLNQALSRRYSHGSSDSMTVSGSNGISVRRPQNADGSRRNSYGCSIDDSVVSDKGTYRGYNPVGHNHRRLPVMLQFHGGGFVSGSNDSAANDFFCRRIARLCDVIVVAVGYRLAPEDKYPAAFDDGFKVVNWLAKQANLAECSKTLVSSRGGGGVDLRRSEGSWQVSDAFGSSMVEPWLAAHGDPSRCVLLGVSCGANIANHMARKVVEAGRLVDPVKVVAQVLMYPFFMGSIPTRSEIKLANSYFYDKPMCVLAWKLFLPPTEFSLDHPAANPLAPGRVGPPLKRMPPTLTVVAEHDWMRDRAIAYSEELRKVNVDAPVLDYKDAVHEFATLDILLKTPQAQACAEDVAIWVKKYISLRGHEFSY